MLDIEEDTLSLAGSGDIGKLRNHLNKSNDATQVAICALFDALKNKMEEESKVLISLPEIQENASYLNNTFLFWARRHQLDEIIQLLLMNPAVALYEAVKDNNITKVRSLIEAGQCAYKFDNQLYKRAEHLGHSDITAYLRKIPEVDLMASADEGNISRVEALLSKNINPTIEGNYILRSAATGGHSELVLLLVKIDSVRNSNVAELSEIMESSAHSENIKEATLIFTIPSVRARAKTRFSLVTDYFYNLAQSKIQKTTDFVSQVLGLQWLLNKYNETKLNGDVLIHILKKNFPKLSEKEISGYLEMNPQKLLNLHYLMEEKKRQREDASNTGRQIRQRVTP